jgi:hypothetical protein
MHKWFLVNATIRMLAIPYKQEYPPLIQPSVYIVCNLQRRSIQQLQALFFHFVHLIEHGRVGWRTINRPPRIWHRPSTWYFTYITAKYQIVNTSANKCQGWNCGLWVLVKIQHIPLDLVRERKLWRASANRKASWMLSPSAQKHRMHKAFKPLAWVQRMKS